MLIFCHSEMIICQLTKWKEDDEFFQFELEGIIF